MQQLNNMHESENHQSKMIQKETELHNEEVSKALIRRQELDTQRDQQNTEHVEAQLRILSSTQTDLAKMEENRKQDAEDARRRIRENQTIAANEREMYRNKINREMDAARDEERARQNQVDTVRATRLLDCELNLQPRFLNGNTLISDKQQVWHWRNRED
jgi:hypothetical protein